MDQHSKQYFLVQVLLCRCPAAERKNTGVYNLPDEFMLGDVDMPMLLADDITDRANKLLGLLSLDGNFQHMSREKIKRGSLP